MAPPYLTAMFVPTVSQQQRQRLRSSSTSTLLIPRTQTRYGDRNFQGGIWRGGRGDMSSSLDFGVPVTGIDLVIPGWDAFNPSHWNGLSVYLSVCLSVYPSHGWISQKWLKLRFSQFSAYYPSSFCLVSFIQKFWRVPMIWRSNKEGVWKTSHRRYWVLSVLWSRVWHFGITQRYRSHDHW